MKCFFPVYNFTSVLYSKSVFLNLTNQSWVKTRFRQLLQFTDMLVVQVTLTTEQPNIWYACMYVELLWMNKLTTRSLYLIFFFFLKFEIKETNILKRCIL